ncbi:hypothetical protein [Paraprevotella xylaniphila]|uniref:hypothetical protein n=1 Tax=Paraprevotella xylaniphila TaxID=454155 RepID=UPI0026DA72CE|nr:hypothetical protein [Paraprevotella xylaniphila]
MGGQSNTHSNSNAIAYYDVRTRLCVGEKFAELVNENPFTDDNPLTRKIGATTNLRSF